MAEKVGDIYYDVEMDTAQLLTANQQASKALDDLGNQAKGAASGIKSLETQMKTSAAAVEQASRAGSGFRSTFQQAGYQVQDFIVQVQGGQSALVAFSQQGSQLAGAFGPGGAIVGAFIALGTVLTGVLMSALGNTSNEMDKLEKAAETLNKIVVINSQGVAALSNDYARLAATNSTLAAQLRDNAIQQYEIGVRDAGKAIQSIVKDQSSWFGSLQGGSASVSALGEVISTLNIKTDSFREAFAEASKTGLGVNNMANTLTATVSMLGSQFSIGDDAAFGLATRLNEIAKNPSPQAISSLIDYMKSLTPTTKDGADAMTELETKILAAGAAMQKAQDNSDALKKKLQDLRTEAQQANFDNVSTQLETQRIALTKGVQAAKEYAISKQDLTDQQKQELIQQSRIVSGLEEEKKARDAAQRQADQQAKTAASAAEQVAQKLENLRQKADLSASSTNELTREQAILQAQQSLGKSATQDQIKLAGQYAAKAYDNAKAVKELAQAEQGRKFANQEITAAKVMPDAETGAIENPTAQIDLQEQQKLAALSKYQAIDVQNVQLYEDAKTAIQRQAANARQQIVENEANMQSQAISSIIGSVSQGFDGLANLAASAAGKSSGAYQAMFALSKGFAVAQAALNLQLAISQAMADPTALTPAQKLANYAAIAGAGASLLSSIGSISYGGGREHGGPVNANNMYRVGEGGKPEFFKASNGSQYMIPGDSGKVISNSDLAGVSGGGVIEQHNYFTIHSTTGDPEELTKQIAQISYQQSLRAMKDQQRPGGMLTQRK